MTYIKRAQIAQRIITAAPGTSVTAVTIYGYREAVAIQTTSPLPGYHYAALLAGGYPRYEFDQDGVRVELVCVREEDQP